MEFLSLDFGASTVDIVFWKDNKISEVKSFESMNHYPVKSLQEFLHTAEITLNNINKIFVSGGKTRLFNEKHIDNKPVIKINEIEAIGHGAHFLTKNIIKENFLAVSMGTGTCMVVVSSVGTGRELSLRIHHIGGTGIGGGTFLGLCKEILGETDIQTLQKMFSTGDKKKVDLSIGEITGGGIGILPPEKTASNLGKLVRNIDFSKSDLASGIVNLVGQAIGTNVIFAAKSENVSKVVLTGKLTSISEITDIIKEVGKLYKIKIFVPENAQYATAIGAGSFFT